MKPVILKLCPECGGKRIGPIQSKHRGTLWVSGFHINCSGCGHMGPTRMHKGSAGVAWNAAA